jgi:hypothetical protein
MGYPPQQPHDPYGRQYQSGPQFQHPYQPQPYMPAVPSGPQYGPVQHVTVKRWGFNLTTFFVHLALWMFLHWWLTLITIGFWLIVAIPVSFIGWRVKQVVPVQHVQQPPYPPQIPPGY